MIDTHVHFWHYNHDEFPWIGEDQAALRQNRLPGDLTALNAGRITGAIAVQARPMLSENDFLLQLAQANPIIKGVIGWFDFDAGIEPQLETAGGHAMIKGFRHLIQDEPQPSLYLTEHQGLQQGVQAIQQQHYIYEVLAHQADLPAVIKFCARHDKHWLVIDHLCKPAFSSPSAFDWWLLHMRKLAALPHVVVKISGLVTEAGPHATAADLQPYVDEVWALFGPERLLWGSDWPVSSATHSYSSLLTYWKDNTSDRQQAEIHRVELATPVKIYQL
ncbi:amidohydrolase family protein [Advenella mimigardefordensis]|uniref:Putative amidohydrolase 2 n=1 Tax=Advenella mimigardefordensis (strain DSM 17166 / LMG 22922 / DPN7) TaxID=1247726 RepID=W0PCB7_ADVMD|nr:amidohydrolase family protein [Advenella mimigardefordensis]AHG63060.1 putative amidohydrolase 2 [Advenella mimigardefordensis DPN7]